MTTLRITVSKDIDISDPLVYTPDAKENFLREGLWNSSHPDPTIYDEIRREIVETMFISEIRVENVEVIQPEPVPLTQEQKIESRKRWDQKYEEGVKRNGDTSGTVGRTSSTDAGESR